MTILALLFMVLMHIIEDFHVQGIMAQMKQRQWWCDTIAEYIVAHPSLNLSGEDFSNTYNDHKIVLLLHGFEWSMFIHAPIIVSHIVYNGWGFSEGFLFVMCITVCLNAIVHAIVDNLKANARSISLVCDQACHIIQVVITYILFEMIL